MVVGTVEFSQKLGVESTRSPHSPSAIKNTSSITRANSISNSSKSTLIKDNSLFHMFLVNHVDSITFNAQDFI